LLDDRPDNLPADRLTIDCDDRSDDRPHNCLSIVLTIALRSPWRLPGDGPDDLSDDFLTIALMIAGRSP